MNCWAHVSGRVELGGMREDSDFAGVTLACGDGWRVEARRMILAGQVLSNGLFRVVVVIKSIALE